METTANTLEPSQPQPSSAPPVVAPPAHILAPFLRDVFTAFNTRGLRWAVLRGAERLPEFTRRDVDILIDPAHLREAHALVGEIAARHGWLRLVEFRNFPCFGQWFMLPAKDGEQPHFLPIELFTRQHQRGFALTDARAGLDGRVLVNHLVWSVRPGFAAANTVMKEVIPWGRLKENARGYVRDGATEDAENFMKAIRPTLGEGELSRRLLETCRHGRWDELPTLSRHLRRAVFRFTPVNIVKSATYFARAAAYRIRPPLSLFAVVLGPDGSGKTTVALELLPQLELRPFQVTKLLKSDFDILPKLKQLKVWAARLRGREAALPPPPPPGTFHAGMGAPNTPLRSMAYVLYYAVDLFLGRLKLRRWRALTGCVFFDRYYYDYYYQRGNSRVPRWFLNLFGILVPKPDLIFYLERDAEEIFARKPELSVDEIRRQQAAIRHLLEGRRQARVIDARHGIDETVRLMRDAVYEHLLRRAGVPGQRDE